MSAALTTRHADLIYSPDDGGYYATLWDLDGDDVTQIDRDCPIYLTVNKAADWARRMGATVLHDRTGD